MKILFLYADDAYFWRNRLGLAAEATDHGFEVVLMAPLSNYRSEIEKVGVRVIPWALSRKSINPFRELWSLFEVIKVHLQERPDIVQHETLKAIVHGGVAARLLGGVPSVNIICGLGAIFSRADRKLRLIRWLLLRILTFAFANHQTRVAFQNAFDMRDFVRMGIIRDEQAFVSPGNGVRVERFMPKPETGGTPIVVLPARMLWEKGVGEFVEAAKELKARGFAARFVLVGTPDTDNPGCIPEEQLRAWERSGVVEWWGQRSDMPEVYAQSTLVCLPSFYGEGLPNVLAEAGASGRAVVATDIPGCRQAVEHDVNGLIVPARDAKALAHAIERLLKDGELRRRLGAMGRERAVKEFSHETIVKQMIGIYRELLGEKWPKGRAAETESKVEVLTEA